MAIKIYIDQRHNPAGYHNAGAVFVNQSLYVLSNTNMPAVLVEMGYLSNYSDAIILRDNLWNIAYGIYLGILSYFGFSPL